VIYCQRFKIKKSNEHLNLAAVRLLRQILEMGKRGLRKRKAPSLLNDRGKKVAQLSGVEPETSGLFFTKTLFSVVL